MEKGRCGDTAHMISCLCEIHNYHHQHGYVGGKDKCLGVQLSMATFLLHSCNSQSRPTEITHTLMAIV